MELTDLGKKGFFGSNKNKDVAQKLAIVIEDLSQIESLGNVAKGLSKNFKKLNDAEDKLRKAADQTDPQKALKQVEKGTGDVLDAGLDIIAAKGDIIQYLNVFVEFGPTLSDALQILLEDVNELVKKLQEEAVQQALANAVSQENVSLDDLDKPSTFSKNDVVRDVLTRVKRVQDNVDNLNRALNALAVFGRSLRRMQMNRNVD